MNEKHTTLVLFCVPLQLLIFSDSVTTDNVWACPAVLTNDLLPSFKRPTETLREAESVMGPCTDKLLCFIPC